jgi:type I restriction enzyme S subunit
MNAERLLQHFERICEVPDAIPCLRRFIFDLAVRGKLVEQDPNDEPASELLKRISEDILIRTSCGSFSPPKNHIEIAKGALPLVVPASWEWGRLIEVADVSYGFAFESVRFNDTRVGMPLIRIRDICSSNTQAYFDGDFNTFYIVHQGDYLVGMDGDFNVSRWKGPDALLNQRVMRVKNWRHGLNPEFLALPLQVILNFLHADTSQTTVKHLSAKQVNGIYLPLPPLAEQHRIVAKVDELMALCDQLEAQLTTAEADSRRLLEAMLHEVLNPPLEALEQTRLGAHV